MTHRPNSLDGKLANDAPVTAVDNDLVTEDLLVEDVSIDGMCGVY